VHISETSFAQCLKELLAQKKVSASELARMMAYKSRNSIFRILDGEGAHGARLAFLERLKEENPLGLEAADFERLTEALEISRVGLAAYRSNMAMRELLAGGDGEKDRIRVITREGREAGEDYAKILHAKELEIGITGCCDRQLMSAMRELLRRRKTTDGVRVAHFIYMGQEELVRVINAIQPMLYAGFYEAYCVEPGVFSKEREQIYRSNCVYIRWLDENGVWRDQPLLLLDRALFFALRGAKASEYQRLGALFAGDMQRMTRLKAEMPLPDGQPDYVAYTDMCRRLEQGRAIYTVKLDVPFPFISTEILLPCALESFEMAGMERAEAERIVHPLAAVHAKRFENIFSKHKVTHTILSRAYMERFAKTGRQTDHFFALRPYTGEERAAILSHIRDQARSNPNFRVHFFRDGFEPPLMEITLYEGECTMLAKPFTDYNLAGDHAEAIIESAQFCERYKAFFTEDLLRRQTTAQEETLAVLDQLIDMAKNA